MSSHQTGRTASSPEPDEVVATATEEGLPMIRLGCRCRVQLVKCINEAAQAKCLPPESTRSGSDGNEPKTNFAKKVSGWVAKAASVCHNGYEDLHELEDG